MAVLLLLLALVAPGFAQSSYSYCPPSPSSQCDCTSDKFQTNYVSFASPSTPQLDNDCHTYFPVANDPCTYVAYFAQVFCDNSSRILSFLVTCNSSNSFLYTSPNCSFLETIVGYSGQNTVTTRQVVRGDCSAIIYPSLAVNPCSGSASASDLGSVQQILNNNGYGCSNVYYLPGRFPSQCVTSQPSSNTGSSTNCQGSNCYGNGYDYDDYYENDYYYNYPPYSYSPPPSCGCGK